MASFKSFLQRTHLLQAKSLPVDETACGSTVATETAVEDGLDATNGIFTPFVVVPTPSLTTACKKPSPSTNSLAPPVLLQAPPPPPTTLAWVLQQPLPSLSLASGVQTHEHKAKVRQHIRTYENHCRSLENKLGALYALDVAHIDVAADTASLQAQRQSAQQLYCLAWQTPNVDCLLDILEALLKPNLTWLRQATQLQPLTPEAHRLTDLWLRRYSIDTLYRETYELLEMLAHKTSLKTSILSKVHDKRLATLAQILQQLAKQIPTNQQRFFDLLQAACETILAGTHKENLLVTGLLQTNLTVERPNNTTEDYAKTLLDRLDSGTLDKPKTLKAVRILSHFATVEHMARLHTYLSQATHAQQENLLNAGCESLAAIAIRQPNTSTALDTCRKAIRMLHHLQSPSQDTTFRIKIDTILKALGKHAQHVSLRQSAVE